MNNKTLVLPTFIIPGAGKSGTSYVASVLSKHKDIFIPFSKEPAFFSTYKNYGYYHRGMDFYQKNFFNYKGEKHIGEASTVYMYDPESPKLIRRHIPDVKLIFILRNPIERTYSNYWQWIKAGKDFPTFYEMLLEREKYKEMKEMIYVSHYEIHLARYLDNFPQKQIKIFLYDDLKVDPLNFINTILQFLNLKPFDELPVTEKVNPAGIPKSKVLSRILRNESITQFIKAHTPSYAQPFLKGVLEKFRDLIIKPIKYPPIDYKSWKILAEEFHLTVEKVSKILGRDLNYWLRYPYENFNNNR